MLNANFHNKKKVDARILWIRFARVDLSRLVARAIRSFIASDVFELSTNKVVWDEKRLPCQCRLNYV
jgi:hypothetical protein